MDPTQKKILFDLTKDYRNKIRQAAAHMHSMCETADIDGVDALAAISAVNMFFVVEIIDQTTDMSAEDFGNTCAEHLRDRRAANRRAKRERTQ